MTESRVLHHQHNAEASADFSCYIASLTHWRHLEAGTLLLELDRATMKSKLDNAQADFDRRKAEAVSAQVTVPIVAAALWHYSISANLIA